MSSQNTIIEITGLKTCLGGDWVHKGIDLSVRRGEVLGIVGGSGSGKTTLLREMMCLTRPSAGTIKIFGQDITAALPADILEIQRRWGVLFQSNALFSSLTLLDNVIFPLKEHTCLDDASIKELALLKILMAGLPVDAALKYPAELSGGMQKRGGLARAIVLDPELIFLDEPTAGLDPNTAAGFDQLIRNLQSTMGLTIVMVTHDLDSLWSVTDRVAFLGEGRVLSVDSMPALVKNPHPLIQEFFGGPRGRAAGESYKHGE
ncbi:putative ribonucleotide transport ATP-binding protein mkl [Aquicella siphonis]|uniref:Putative ribonucleotide transport ATP-binding protein mkl n=1 Tax=Aquicella siphonis TaxID=254247 RepID=A0A5E4PG05_9COXI|nr:ATP-binding cassette domain-containing protein [Aquicella siphonis]VVC75849.1 putative ribonucleotide transport ATP-binding protein mkl [Aquicella siphonis]